MKKASLLVGMVCMLTVLHAQDAASLVEKVKAKYERVKDYEATARMKTNVSFLKTPTADVKIYYRKPDQFRMQNEAGVSFIPKGSVNVNMGNIFSLKEYTAIDAGTEKIGDVLARVIKIIPTGNDQELVLATLYIDEKRELVLRSVSSTRDNGSYELNMTYGKYAAYGLPDRLLFSFNTKEYKLPKGVTLDYDNGSTGGNRDAGKNTTGEIELQYSQYQVNKGVPDSVFR